MSSLYPNGGEFFRKIDANPDLYGLIWISTTLVFVIASLGNCATYLMRKRSDHNTSWSFDVSYINVAACAVYGYALVVPVTFYFLLQYLGSNASLVRFWCMWGYSLFVFILSSVSITFLEGSQLRGFNPLRSQCRSGGLDLVEGGFEPGNDGPSRYLTHLATINFQFLLVIPVEFLRWIIIILTGAASACFVALNIKSYIEGSDLTVVVVASFFLQMALALFIKIWFFP
ncbi:hypothetical protein HHK36_019112 [Tetracentron sinense]|uniref:Protein YIP n=1 Tax=Tetracentron sinense TaxID=13715 RepID=A0A834YYP8_TETSI|nr:hypothetical protein HHK36_019112 [Tetracentron sinense]